MRKALTLPAPLSRQTAQVNGRMGWWAASAWNQNIAGLVAKIAITGLAAFERPDSFWCCENRGLGCLTYFRIAQTRQHGPAARRYPSRCIVTLARR